MRRPSCWRLTSIGPARGNDESFTAEMIVSEADLAPEITGLQNLWVQGVRCGDAIVHFSE